MREWTRAAQRFATCRYVSEREVLAVSFQNGEAFQIPVETLLGTSVAGVDWNRVQIGETGDTLELRTTRGITEIPWDRVRCVADPEFRRHLANRAVASARRVGGRLKLLRRARGLTQEAVARSAGVDRVTISRIENGRLQATYETLARIVSSLGKTMQDLAAEPTLADGPRPAAARSK
jgi:DNA-binding XRE family transcriptional regulator